MFEHAVRSLYPVALPLGLQPQDAAPSLGGTREMSASPSLAPELGWQGGISEDVLKVFGHYADSPPPRRAPDLPIDPSGIPNPGTDTLPANRLSPSPMPPDKLQYAPAGGITPRPIDNEPLRSGSVSQPASKMSAGREEPPLFSVSTDMLPDAPARQNFNPTGPIDALGWASGEDAVKRSDTQRGRATLGGFDAETSMSRHRNADNEVVGVSTNGKLGMPGWTRYLGGPLGGLLLDAVDAQDLGPNYNYGSGSFLDPDGKQTYGVQGAVGTRKFSAEQSFSLANGTPQKGGPEWYIGGDMSGPDANAAITANDSTLQLGMQANYGSASATIGTRGTGNQDRSFRFGLSHGAGAAARLHYGDEDKDGRREYGFGFDYGPVAMDFKTEDPLGDLWRGATAGSPLMYAANLIGGGVQQDGRTLTEAAHVNEAVDTLGTLGKECAGAGRRLYRTALKKAEADPSSLYAGMY